jgi:hypothetical protein
MDRLPFSHGDTSPAQEPQALLIRGEAVAALIPRLEELRQYAAGLAGGLSLEVSILADFESVDRSEDEPVPVPVTREDFRAFAAANGYSDNRACRAWLVARWSRRGSSVRGIELQPIHYLSKDGKRLEEDEWGHLENERILDLCSVRDRLSATGNADDAWQSATKPTISFLADLVQKTWNDLNR